MGVQDIVERFAKQTAVYWGNPTPDGYGNYTYDSPVEISVRWEDETELTLDNDGKERVSRAKVMVTQDVDEGGLLYLGTLDDLDSGEESDPTTVSAAYPIIRFEKTPDIKAVEFVRMAYL